MKIFKNTRGLKRGLSVCLLFFATGVICYFLTADLRPAPNPAEMLPPSTIALLKWKNFAHSFTRFKTSPLGRKILAGELDQDLDLCGVCPTTQHRIIEFVDAVQKISSHPLFPVLLGKNAAAAILPPARTDKNTSNFLERHLVFITETKGPFAGYAIKQRLSVHVTAKPEIFQGIEVNQLTLENGRQAYFALIDRMLIAAAGRESVQRCLKVYQDHLISPRVSLMQDHRFSRFRQYTSQQEVCFMYINPGFGHGDLHLPRFSPLQEAHLAGPDTRFLLLHKENKDRDHFSLMVAGIPRQEDALFQKYLPAPPQIPQQLSQIDIDASAYAWTNWFNLQALWQGMSHSSEVQTAAVVFYLNNVIRKHTGLEMGKLAGMFGNEAGLLITEFPSAPFATIPMICLQIQVRDSHAVRRLLRKLLVHVPSRPVVVEGIPGTSLIMANGLIEPTYLFYEDYLVVADSAELIRHWVGTQKKKMVDSTEFKMVNGGLLQHNNLISYARIDKVNNGLQKIIQWSLYTLHQAGRITPQQGAFIQDELVGTIFDSLQSIRSQGIRVAMEGDMLIGELNLYAPQNVRKQSQQPALKGGSSAK